MAQAQKRSFVACGAYLAAFDVLEHMRLYVLSGVQCETSAPLAICRSASRLGKISIDRKALHYGDLSGTIDPVPGYPFNCHTHPLFSVATSCNSPSSCPTGTDLASDLTNLARTGHACSLTLTTNGAYFTWGTSFAKKLFASLSDQEKVVVLRVINMALATEIGDRYSMGDAIASMCNERDLMCGEPRIGMIRKSVERASRSRKHAAALSAGFRGLRAKNDASGREWAKLVKRFCTIDVMRNYLRIVSSEMADLDSVRAKLEPYARRPLLEARFYSIGEIESKRTLRVPRGCIVPCAFTPPVPTKSVRGKRFGVFDRRDFRRMFITPSPGLVSDSAEDLAKRIWRSIGRSKNGYAAKMISKALATKAKPAPEKALAAKACGTDGVLSSEIDFEALVKAGAIPSSPPKNL